ncbi:glycosyltransferase [Catenuloplanes atrovinosus]|uniref:Glycosyltransferase involved in cell wall biosynthesis n=1 Tax=Catenuloplanes atrovinosus TaxID=137266 RepID=A0AAE4C8J8_9ACTN|nr:glycosyltransferase [Catenuloplanes atrovinosus]MDR7275606.1 glycosyltransferase involved in cell wall biosynthesis [Catenuloplanes atrovinosus]
MTITVVVLTYDSEETLDACLDSLAGQSTLPAEIIVVDDDSTDRTLDITAAFAAHSPVPVRVLRNGSHNISRGRNIGLAAATTPIVAFIDSDAWADPGWIAGLADAFAVHPEAAVIGGGVDTDHATAFARAIAINDGAVRAAATTGSLLVAGCNLAVHRDRAGGAGFDERWVYAEDIEYAHRIRHWAIAPSARVRHASRATPRRYLRQMYLYGLWKARYTLHTGHVRLVDWSASAALLGTPVLALLLGPWWLLAYPAFCAAETLVVAVFRRPAPWLLPLMFLGWLVKNTGWGIGMLAGLGRGAVREPRTPVPAGTAG